MTNAVTDLAPSGCDDIPCSPDSPASPVPCSPAPGCVAGIYLSAPPVSATTCVSAELMAAPRPTGIVPLPCFLKLPTPPPRA